MVASSGNGEARSSPLSPRSARIQMEKALGKLDITEEEAIPLVLDDCEIGRGKAEVVAGRKSSASHDFPHPDDLSIVRQEGPALLFVMETKISGKRVENLRVSLGFAGCYAVDSDGLSGGIGLFWSSDVLVEIENYSANHIDATVQKADLSSPKWRFTGFYGEPRVENRHHSWRFLRTLHAISQGSWLCMGDFNETLYGEEHFSNVPRPEWQMRAFREAVEDY
ncbi:hypothetical protein ACQ4PT_001352 [Festuca glaucescens]